MFPIRSFNPKNIDIYFFIAFLSTLFKCAVSNAKTCFC